MLVGEIAALIAAFLWASSSIVYRFLGQRIPPLSLNILKGIVAIILIQLTLALTVQPAGWDLESWRIWLLAVSGVVGIGLGDTAYFFALNCLGARRTLVLETLAPPLGALLAFVIIGEVISPIAVLGIAITLSGVIWVIGEQTTVENISDLSGIVWALLAAIAQAGGAVMSRIALLDSDVSPLTSSMIRIAAGVLIACVLSFLPVFQRELAFQKKLLKFRLPPKVLGLIVLAATGSTYLGIGLQQVSLKHAPTGIAQTLLATSPLFVIPLSMIMGEKVSLRAILGAVVALVGISLLLV